MRAKHWADRQAGNGRAARPPSELSSDSKPRRRRRPARRLFSRASSSAQLRSPPASPRASLASDRDSLHCRPVPTHAPVSHLPARCSAMGNQTSSAPVTPRPIYTVRSDPVPAAGKTASSAEPVDSDECHACAARQDSQAISPVHADTDLASAIPHASDSSQTHTSLTAASVTTSAVAASSAAPCYAYSHSACPLNRAELGRAAWAHLHTMAAYYPLQPSPGEQLDMRSFVLLYMRQYPCLYCRDRTMEEVERNPPRVHDRAALSEWLCEVHNEVNERLGKQSFDCKRVDERWRTGPADGSCGG